MCLIKAQVIEFGNEATWSTRRVERAPGTPFSWATCDETKVAALPRSRGQDDGRGWRRPEGGVGNQRCEDNSCSAARYSPPSSNLLREMVKGTEQSCYAQAEVLGTDRPCRGPLEFQRQRADIADGQTLTTSQYYLHRYKAPSVELRSPFAVGFGLFSGL